MVSQGKGTEEKQTDKTKSASPQNEKKDEIRQEAVTNVSAEVITIGNISQTVNQYAQNRDIEFFPRINLEEFDDPYFPQIACLDSILQLIQEQRILVLGSNHADKSALAWHLAIRLQQSIQGDSASAIYGWESTSDSKGLVAAIRRECYDTRSGSQKPAKAFVLLNLNPQNVTLAALKEIAREARIFVIATTETPREKWSLSQAEDRIWCDSSTLLYEPNSLAAVAIAHIRHKEIVISAEMEQEIRRRVVGELQTVASIDIFIDGLRTSKQPLSFDDLNLAIQTAKEDKTARLKKWFRQLSSREQLLAVGITLLDGLDTDQFFAALERIVENVWQQRDPSLRALDHCDLENLGHYYEFVDVRKEDDFLLRRLNVKDAEAGSLLLGIAWESHRRQIITALGEIVQIIQDSAKEQFQRLSDHQIYGNTSLQKRLYKATSKSFAAIGLVTAEATASVRGLLLVLASNHKLVTQGFVATVLAYWYKRDAGKLSRTLQFFHDYANRRPFERPDPDQINRQNYVDATISLAVSYASLNDLPNYLHPQLCDWLTTLSSSKKDLTRVYFGWHTLAYVVPRHFLQIYPILEAIAEQQSDLTPAIAQSLAAAYENYPDEVLNCLKAWSRDSQRITLLCLVARAYGLIDCSLYPDTLTPQAAFEKLEILLRGERRVMVREAVVQGMGDRLEQDCLTIAPMVLNQVAKFTKSERHQFVTHLTDIYLVQREQLTGGESFYETNQVRYRIWINSKRPLTEIEQVILQWLGQNQNKTAQQIATEAAINFAKALDISETTELIRLRSLQPSAMNQDGVLQKDNSKPWNENWFAPIAAWLATSKDKVYQPVVQNILPEALIHHTSYREGMDFVLRRWERSLNRSIGDDDQLKLQPTAVSLRRGLWVMDNKVPLLVVGTGAAILTLMTLQTMGNHLISLLPRGGQTSGSRQSTAAPRAIDGGISIADAIGVQDIDSPNFNKGELQVSFTANGTADDLLSILNQGSGSGQIGINGNQVLYGGKVIGSYTEGNGDKPLVVTFNAEATPVATESLLRTIAYKNNVTPVTPGSRTVQFVLTDGSGGISKPLLRKISLVAPNQPPAIAAPESFSTKEGNPFRYGKIDITDPDSQTVTVQLSVENGTLAVNSEVPKGIKTEDMTGNESKTVELKGSLAKIKTTLAHPSAITYRPNADFAGDDSLNITVTDNGPTLSDKDVSLVWTPDARLPQKVNQAIKIAVTPRNQFPVVTLPGNQNANEDQDLNISGILIKDPDSKEVSVTLSVQNGSLKVKSNVAAGLKANNINGNASASVTLKGAIATINTTLADPAAITYRSKLNYNGSDSLKIRVDDGGKGAETALTITVNPVNDAPELGTVQPIPSPVTTLPSPSVSNTITQEQALNVIRSYIQAKREIFAPPFSREAAARYTTGMLYNDIVQPGKAIDWLSQRNQYYKYGSQQVDFLGGFVAAGDRASINVRLTEEVTLYENNYVKTPAQTTPKTYRFELRLENDIWKISDYKDL